MIEVSYYIIIIIYDLRLNIFASEIHCSLFVMVFICCCLLILLIFKYAGCRDVELGPDAGLYIIIVSIQCLLLLVFFRKKTTLKKKSACNVQIEISFTKKYRIQFLPYLMSTYSKYFRNLKWFQFISAHFNPVHCSFSFYLALMFKKSSSYFILWPACTTCFWYFYICLFHLFLLLSLWSLVFFFSLFLSAGISLDHSMKYHWAKSSKKLLEMAKIKWTSSFSLFTYCSTWPVTMLVLAE